VPHPGAEHSADAGPRAPVHPAEWPTLAVIACGGVIGALARHGLGVAFPQPPAAFPWTIFGINIAGCLLIGVLMAAIAEIRSAPGWLRPLLGVGVLGGFTTFSTYVLDIGRLLLAGAPHTALLYLVATPVTAVAAAWTGDTVTRSLVRRGRRGRRP